MFEKLNKLDEKSYSGWSALAFIYMQRKDYKAALEYYNQSIDRKSTYAGDYINRGSINNDNKNFKQALLDFNNAIKFDSTEVLGYYNRASLLLYLGDENNALKDLGKTVELDSTNYDARLNKAILELTLSHNYKQAITDYKVILEKYPYFIPALSGVAVAEESLGNYQRAAIYNQQIRNIDKNKDYFKQKAKESIVASNKISKSIKENGLVIKKNKNKLFNEFDTYLIDSTTISISGKIQNRNVNIINEKNFSINSIVINKLPRSTNLSRAEIDVINRLKIVPVYFCLSNNEIPLLSDIISIHFTAIKTITDSLSNRNNQVEKYLSRGIEFSLVKDYIGALNDFDKVIQISPDYILGYFSRANIRLKLIESQGTSNKSSFNDVKINKQQFINPEITDFEDDSNFTYQMIIEDYDKVIKLSPDFSFAYYNKANILCTQKDFQTAISYYSKSIEIDPDFAEAYFNRGLTYLFIGEDAKGLVDLSKAGELGIYKAYNLIQRFKK
jgi:tetratricopeptide (TPR) repeat protein